MVKFGLFFVSDQFFTKKEYFYGIQTLTILREKEIFDLYHLLG